MQFKTFTRNVASNKTQFLVRKTTMNVCSIVVNYIYKNATWNCCLRIKRQHLCVYFRKYKIFFFKSYLLSYYCFSNSQMKYYYFNENNFNRSDFFYNNLHRICRAHVKYTTNIFHQSQIAEFWLVMKQNFYVKYLFSPCLVHFQII